MAGPSTPKAAAALAALAVAALLLAGCLGGSPGGETEAVVPAGVTLAALGAPTLVSAPGHRVAEFMVARNPHDPMHLVAAFGDYDSPGGVLNCAFAASFDGGQRWTVSDPVPGFSGPYLQFDGWVDFDGHGGVHAICIQQAGPGATAQAWPFHFRSADGGLTWGEARRIPTEVPDRSTDKTVLGAGRDGTLYAAVSNLVGTSRDNGTTWVPMAPVYDDLATFNGMVEDGAGTMFLLGVAGGDVTLARTPDGGATWDRTAIGPFTRPPGYNDQNRWVDQRPWIALPNVAHDPLTDDLWVTYQSWDEGYGGYRLHLFRSTDHGATFRAVPAPSFASPLCADPCHVTHPSLAFDDAGRAALLVQLTRDEGLLKVVQVAASADQGRTWTAPLQLSHADGMDSWRNPEAFRPLPGNAQAVAAGVASDPASAHNAAAGVALSTAVSELQMRWNGEYWGLAASPKGFVAMWIDHSGGGRPQLWSQVVVPGG
jgi:hypothetical protein